MAKELRIRATNLKKSAAALVRRIKDCSGSCWEALEKSAAAETMRKAWTRSSPATEDGASAAADFVFNFKFAAANAKIIRAATTRDKIPSPNSSAHIAGTKTAQ